MKVQRIRFPEREHITWLVLDDEYQPAQPILSYLTFLDDLGRSPNTIRATAQHLKTFWEFLRDQRLDWTEVDVAHLAAFIRWLRRPDPNATSIEPKLPRRTNATIDLILTSVHGLYEYHQRLHTVPNLPLYRCWPYCSAQAFASGRHSDCVMRMSPLKRGRSRLCRVRRIPMAPAPRHEAPTPFPV